MGVLSFPIEKYEGAGNDFIIIDEWENEVIPEEYKSKVASDLCRRAGSIGADGVLFWSASSKADGRMRTFNADGSEAEICGNGLRCVARYAWEKKEIESVNMTVETVKGISELSLILDGSGGIEKIKVLIGEPSFLAGDIPMSGEPGQTLIDGDLFVNEAIGMLKVTALSVGNPHVVYFVDSLDKADVESIGKAVECHPSFPNRTNVDVVQVESEKSFRIRTFERGVGMTLSCGTGVVASATAGVVTGRLLRNTEITAVNDGGILWSEIVERENRIMAYLIGPARRLSSGEATVEI